MSDRDIPRRIIQTLEAVHLDPYDYAKVVYCYLLAKLNIKHSSDDRYLDGLMDDGVIEDLLLHHVESSAIRKDELISLGEFSEFLVENRLDKNHDRFFDFAARYAAWDWNTLRKVFPERNVENLLYALYLILERTAEYPFGETAFTSPTIRQIYEKDADVFALIGLSTEEYERCWRAVHFLPLAEPICKPSNKTKKAIKQYDAVNVPRPQLLSDINTLLEAEITGTVAPSPWKTGSGKVGKKGIEKGLTDDEELYRTAARSIMHEPITDVIQAAFYDNRDDAKIECSFIFQEFSRWLHGDMRVLIVNPSPNFIAYWDENALPGIHTTCAVTDDTIAALYARAYPDYTFVPITDASQFRYKFDRVLILARDMPLGALYATLNAAKPSARIMAFLPETAITLPSESVVPHIAAQNMSILRIFRIPTGITGSKPRKKVLLYAAFGEFAHCELYDCSVYTGNLVVEKRYRPIPREWLNGTLTTQQMIDEYEKRTKGTAVHSPNEPRIRKISKEINLYYTVQEKRGKIIGRARYRAILTDEDKGKKRGDNLSGAPVERGLHVKSMDELLPALDKVPFYPVINPSIKQDIDRCYRGRFHEMSLKTIWICCYGTLSDKVTYDHEIAELLLNGPMGSLLPHSADVDAFRHELEPLLTPTARTGRKYWQQLNLIMQTAVAEGYLQQNPIAAYWTELQKNRASEGVEEVRAAQTRKFLYHQEIMKMIAFLREEIVPAGQTKKVKRYVAESKWFAGLFELFADIKISESSLLTWGDICQIADLPMYSVWITKQQDDNGNVRNYETYQKRDKYRCTPLDQLLYEMLMERYRYLQDTYHLTIKQLTNKPIILETEPAKRYFAKKNGLHISRTNARKARSAWLQKAEIPKDLVTLHDKGTVYDTDLNEYGGELLRTTYQHYANHLCGFHNGELCYVAGRKAPDVFSDNYCEYSDDEIQAQMICKLNRWTSTYRDTPAGTTTSHRYEETICRTATDIALAPPGKLAAINMVLRLPAEKQAEQLKVTIDSKYGFCGEIVAYPGE
jgi:hypothetical protein